MTMNWKALFTMCVIMKQDDLAVIIVFFSDTNQCTIGQPKKMWYFVGCVNLNVDVFF